MNTKLRRTKLLELITEHEISTQEEIVQRLLELGFDVTQATISRDLKALKLVKVKGASVNSKYAIAETIVPTYNQSKISNLFKESFKDIKFVNNTIVIKTIEGAASSACSFIDSLSIPGILGSVAGDDTIITITDSLESSKKVVDILLEHVEL